MNFHLSCDKPISAFNFDKIYYYDSERLRHNFTLTQLEKIAKFMKNYDFEFENICRFLDHQNFFASSI